MTPAMIDHDVKPMDIDHGEKGGYISIRKASTDKQKQKNQMNKTEIAGSKPQQLQLADVACQ